MKLWQLVVCGMLYLWAAYDFYELNDNGMALAFMAYAVANIGFIISKYNV